MAKAVDPELVQKREKFSGLAIPDDFGRAKQLIENSPKKEEPEVKGKVLMKNNFLYLNLSLYKIIFIKN